MDKVKKNRLFTTLYQGFFANNTHTVEQMLEYYQWTNILLCWLTTTKSERRIAADCQRDKNFIDRLKKHCQKKNEALYLTCLKTRKENLKKGKTTHARP